MCIVTSEDSQGRSLSDRVQLPRRHKSRSRWWLCPVAHGLSWQSREEGSASPANKSSASVNWAA